MKKLRMLTALLLVSFSSISQTIIPETTNSDCAVCLDTIQARKVIKDIITGKAATEELKVTKEIVKNLELSLETQINITSDWEAQYDNLVLINEEKDFQLSLMKSAAKDQADQLKAQKKKTTFYKITTLAALVGAGALLISN